MAAALASKPPEQVIKIDYHKTLHGVMCPVRIMIQLCYATCIWFDVELGLKP